MRYFNVGALSVSHINGSHTPAVRGGEIVEYQGWKKRKTTNALYFTDRQGLALVMSESQKGNHTDFYEVENRVDEMVTQIRTVEIILTIYFKNTDAGFDGKIFREALTKHKIISNVCSNPRNGESKEEQLFDTEFYKECWIIEWTNTWINSFRLILTRLDTTASSWKEWNYLTFTILLLRQVGKVNKFRWLHLVNKVFDIYNWFII